MKRRSFLKNAAILNAGVGVAGTRAFPERKMADPGPGLPRWKGFNLLDYFSPVPPRSWERRAVKDDHFMWMRDWGFDFVRLPMAYPRFLEIDHSREITPEDVYRIDQSEVDRVGEIVRRANNFGLHVSLNLHRAPGYCVNAGFHEPYNLWLDEEAQDAFVFHWEMWARMFSSLSRDQVSLTW